jgi:hypothetical protein
LLFIVNAAFPVFAGNCEVRSKAIRRIQSALDCFQLRKDNGAAGTVIFPVRSAVKQCIFSAVKGMSRNIRQFKLSRPSLRIRRDCFTLRDDGSADWLHQSPFSLFALMKCTVFFLMTTQVLRFATI